MANLIIVVLLILTVGAAVSYIIKEKKKGVKCIGCPAAGGCAHSHSAGSGCGCGGSGKSSCGCHSENRS